MKLKKINSINYGPRIIFIGIILIIPIPLILFGINRVVHNSILQYLILASIILGFIIEAVFLVHLSIELWQDKKINKYYQQHRNIKIVHSSGKYECGNCGNINVKRTDTECMLCGIHFQNSENKSPQDILNDAGKRK